MRFFSIKHTLSFIISAFIIMAPFSLNGRTPAMGFSIYAHSYLGTDHQPHVRISANVSYDTMVFIKKKDLYEASYELYIKILDSKGNLVESAVLHDKVVVKSYKDTHSRRNISKVAKTFDIDPGDYVIDAVLMVKHTHLKIPKMISVTVPHFLSTGVGLSIPRFFTVQRDETDTSSPLRSIKFLGSEEVEEKEHPSIFGFDVQPALAFEVYTESQGNDSIPCVLSYEVVDHNKQQLLYGRHEVQVSGLGDGFVVTFGIDEWEPGSYKFNVKAVLEDPLRETTSLLQFTIEFNRAMLGKYFDQTIAILSLIASKEELAGLEKAPAEDRPLAWAEFWKQRDPTPTTEANEALEEHLRRVRHVATHFASVQPGWKTDRGRIYIKYGEPDNVEVATDPYLQGEYQIWRYFAAGLVFVFYDRFGLGDFQLIRTETF